MKFYSGSKGRFSRIFRPSFQPVDPLAAPEPVMILEEKSEPATGADQKGKDTLPKPTATPPEKQSLSKEPAGGQEDQQKAVTTKTPTINKPNKANKTNDKENSQKSSQSQNQSSTTPKKVIKNDNSQIAKKQHNKKVNTNANTPRARAKVASAKEKALKKISEKLACLKDKLAN